VSPRAVDYRAHARGYLTKKTYRGERTGNLSRAGARAGTRAVPISELRVNAQARARYNMRRAMGETARSFYIDTPSDNCSKSFG
jgi:hypothetical protein